MIPYLAKLCRVVLRSQPAVRLQNAMRTRLEIEHLEMRDVPAAGITLLSDGILRIQASDYGDYVTIKIDDGADGPGESPKNDYVVVRRVYSTDATGSYHKVEQQ